MAGFLCIASFCDRLFAVVGQKGEKGFAGQPGTPGIPGNPGQGGLNGIPGVAGDKGQPLCQFIYHDNTYVVLFLHPWLLPCR